jgi:hypothetical protein
LVRARPRDTGRALPRRASSARADEHALNSREVGYRISVPLRTRPDAPALSDLHGWDIDQELRRWRNHGSFGEALSTSRFHSALPSHSWAVAHSPVPAAGRTDERPRRSRPDRSVWHLSKGVPKKPRSRAVTARATPATRRLSREVRNGPRRSWFRDTDLVRSTAWPSRRGVVLGRLIRRCGSGG